MGSSTVRLLAAHALVAVRAPVEARVARRCCASYRRRRLHVAPRAAAEDQRGGEFVAQTQSPPMLRSPGAAKRRFFAMRRTRPYGISSAWDRCCLAPKATLLRQVCRRTGTHSSPPRTEKNYLNQCANVRASSRDGRFDQISGELLATNDAVQNRVCFRNQPWGREFLLRNRPKAVTQNLG